MNAPLPACGRTRFHGTSDLPICDSGGGRRRRKRVFAGSATGLVAHLLEKGQVSGEELAQIRELIDEKKAN